MLNVRSKFGGNNTIKTYLSKPSEEVFLKHTQQFIDNLFLNCFNKNNTIILDQAISPNNIANTLKYFNSSKVIVMDRDPRDIYANLYKNGILIGADMDRSDSVDMYVKWHKILRENLQSEIASKNFSKNVLRLNYEDLVLDYSNSVDKVINFIGVDVVHKDQYKYFNPKGKKAKDSIRLRKDFSDQGVMYQIQDKLAQYCIKD